MSVTDPRNRIGDSDSDGGVADVRTTDPDVDTAGLVVRIAGTVPAPSLSANAATETTLSAAKVDLDTLVARTPALSSGRVPVDASGVAVPVTDNGGSLTIDGTVTANQGTGGSSAWKVDGSAVTQPVSDSGGSLTVDGTVAVSGVGGTVAVSAAALPLPSGAATSANQATQITSIASIDAKTPSLVGGAVPVTLGTSVPAGSNVIGAVTGPSAVALAKDSTLTDASARVGVLGANGTSLASNVNPLPVSDAGGSVTVDGTVAVSAVGGSVAVTSAGLTNIDVALSTRALETGGNLASIATSTGRIPSQGQALAASSIPVVLPALQASALAQDVSLTGVQGTTGSAVPSKALLVAGIDQAGNLRPQLVDPQGRSITATTDFFGRQRTERTRLVNRGYVVRSGSSVLFSNFTASGGTVVFNATNGTYDSATTTTAGSVAIDIHNKVIHYREGFVFGALISGRMSNTTATNNRKEWGLVAGVATSAAAILAADACGFYYEGGIVGVFYRSSISGATTQIQQASWNKDKLDGTGVSGFTFTASTALLDMFVYESQLVWLGAHGIRFLIGGRLVHEVDFTAAGSRTQTPYTRVPHMRPYVMNLNNTASASSAASTFNRNCLAGYVNTTEEPTTYPFAAQRTSGITLNVALTTFPVMLLRINSAAPERILLPIAALVRATNQDTEWVAYIGKGSDFTVTGGAWSTPPNNPDTQVEYNITATAITIGAGAQRVPLGEFVDVSVSLNADLDFAGFLSEEHRWVGINGDGTQMIFAICAVPQAGNNAVATVREFIALEHG